MARVVEGATALREFERFESLWNELEAPYCARSPWLDSYARSFPDVTPVIFSIEEEKGPVAMACLARGRGPVVQWTSLGHGANDYAPVIARDIGAAAALADLVARTVTTGRRPWRLRLEQLPREDPTVAHLTDLLQFSGSVAGTSAARLTLSTPRTMENHVSRNARRTLNKSWNRLRRAGYDVQLSHTRDKESIITMIEQMVELHRGRDHHLGRRSDLDDRSSREFYRQIVREFAKRGQLELTVLMFDGSLAAYTLAVLDGANYRLWDGRYSTEWSDYSPGRICDLEAIQSALADERFDQVDWMRGVLSYKTQAMTHVAEFEHVHAWSSPVVRAGYAIALAVRQLVRAGVPTQFRHWARTRVR